MRLKLCGLLAVQIVTVSGTPVAAQGATSWLYSADAGLSIADSIKGLGLSVGLARQWSRLRVASALDLVLEPSLDHRYYRDLSSTTTTCRDHQTGGLVGESNCVRMKIAAAVPTGVELTISRAVPLIVGAGYRLGDAPGPYVAMGYSGPFARAHAIWRAMAVVGDRYVSIRWGLAADVRSSRENGGSSSARAIAHHRPAR